MLKFLLIQFLIVLILISCTKQNEINTVRYQYKIRLIDSLTNSSVQYVKVVTENNTIITSNLQGEFEFTHHEHSLNFRVYHSSYRLQRYHLEWSDKKMDVLLYPIKLFISLKEPKLVSPINDSKVTIPNPILYWISDSSHVYYNVYGGNVKGSLNLIATRIKKNFFNIEKLPLGENFYWQIEAINQSGMSIKSKVANLIRVKNNPRTNLNIIAYWSFDNGTAEDFSGNGYHGKLINPERISFVKGKSGKAVKLFGLGNNEGEGGYIKIPLINLDTFEDFIIEMYVLEEEMSYPQGNAFLSFGDWNYGSILIGDIINPLYSFKELMLVMGYMHYDDIKNTYIAVPYITNFRPAIREWNHYKLKYMHGIFFLYLNGKFIGKKYQKISLHGNYAAIGAHFWNNGKSIASRFTGIIDEVVIYRK